MLVKSLNEMAPMIGESVPDARKILAILCKNKLEVLAIFDHFQEHSYSTNEAAARAMPGMELTSFKKYGTQLLQYLKRMISLSVEDNSPEDETIAMDMLLIRLLEYRSRRHTVRIIASDMLSKGIRSERPIWVRDALEVLLRTYSSAGYERIKEFEEYQAMLEQYNGYVFVQNEAIRLLAAQNAIKQRKKSTTTELIEQLKMATGKLSEHINKVPSYTFTTCYYAMSYDLCFLTGRFNEAYTTAKQAITYLETRVYDVEYRLSVYYTRLAHCCRMLYRYEEGEGHILTALEKAPTGSIHWFVALEVGFYLRMYKGDYMRAAEYYLKATRHKKFISLSPSLQETWVITGAYLFIALRASGAELPKGLPTYKSTKFLNDISHYQHDKNGLYAAALVAHLLLTHVEGQSDKIIDRVDALEKYRERYLLDGTAPRTAQFFKILSVMGRSGFQKHLYSDKLPDMLQELANAGSMEERLSFEWEIMPVEDLIGLMEGETSSGPGFGGRLLGQNV